MYVMIKLLVNAITYCFLCARYNNKHFTNVGSFHPHECNYLYKIMPVYFLELQ